MYEVNEKYVCLKGAWFEEKSGNYKLNMYSNYFASFDGFDVGGVF